MAERKRQELEQARESLISQTRAAVERAFSNAPSDPFSPYHWRDFADVEVRVTCSADVLLYNALRHEAEATFMGERFEYRMGGEDGMELFHLWTCPTCQSVQRSEYGIDSLSDLGYWLEEAPKSCQHGESSS